MVLIFTAATNHKKIAWDVRYNITINRQEEHHHPCIIIQSTTHTQQLSNIIQSTSSSLPPLTPHHPIRMTELWYPTCYLPPSLNLSIANHSDPNNLGPLPRIMFGLPIVYTTRRPRWQWNDSSSNHPHHLPKSQKRSLAVLVLLLYWQSSIQPPQSTTLVN